MEAKYYTPTIEEFHVGFEFERELLGPYWEHSGWQKEIVTNETNLKTIEQYINCNRVKYLDIGDIESLGWVQRDYDTFDFGKNTAFEFIPEDTSFLYTYGNGKNSHIIFQGEVKNKSQLKQLMIQHKLIEETP